MAYIFDGRSGALFAVAAEMRVNRDLIGLAVRGEIFYGGGGGGWGGICSRKFNYAERNETGRINGGPICSGPGGRFVTEVINIECLFSSSLPSGVLCEVAGSCLVPVTANTVKPTCNVNKYNFCVFNCWIGYFFTMYILLFIVYMFFS